MCSSTMLADFEEALALFKRGAPVILVDDEDRENEGDITIATEFLSEDVLHLMVKEARGLACVSLPRDHGVRLGLRAQVGANQSRFSTPFTATVDHVSVREQGQTVPSRVRTMRSLAQVGAAPEEFVSPGHCFPLLAHPAGVFGRIGQTEGGYDLARLSGLFPSAVICEVLNPDGSMARGEALQRFADTHRMPIVSVRQIADYRTRYDARVLLLGSQSGESFWGPARLYRFLDECNNREHYAVVFGEIDAAQVEGLAPLVRVHSECFTGDLLGSQRCDCGPQLDFACSMMAAAATEKGAARRAGVLVYLRQEGRGIGLANKLRAYELQDRGVDTVDANAQLGLPIDSRSYSMAANILSALGLTEIALITNNPNKIEQLSASGVKIVERIPTPYTTLGDQARRYVETKQRRLGHLASP